MKFLFTVKSSLTVVFAYALLQTVSGQSATWTTYSHSNSSLPSDTVYSITKDNSGNKWIGTANGLAKFDGTIWTIYNTTNSGIPSNKVRAVAIDKLGNKWIGTDGGGAAMFNGTTWTQFNPSNSIITGWNVRGIAVDTNNNKWFASNSIAKLDAANNNTNAWYMPYCTGNIPDTILLCVAIDGRDIRWMGASLEAAEYCDPYWNNLNFGPINTIAIDDHDKVWLGGLYGFFAMDTITACGNFSFALHYPSEINLTSNNVTAIAFDNCGYAWIGTKGAGFGRYTGNAATAIGMTQSNSPIPSNEINCITTIGSEKWIGSTAGLTIFNSTCQYTSIAEPFDIASAITIFPNPSNQNFTVTLPEHKTYSITLTDFLGKEIYHVAIATGQIEIDASSFSDGIYFLQALNNSERLTYKIIKQ